MNTSNTTKTPAQRAMALLHETPNGGWSFSGTGRAACAAFDSIPCDHECDEIKEVDLYTYDGGEDGDDLVLSMNWEGEEFYIV